MGPAPNPYLRANMARSVSVALLLVFIISTLLFLLSSWLGVAHQSVNVRLDCDDLLHIPSCLLVFSINKAVRGEHSRIVTTEDGKQVRLSANPLNTCTSLDTPLDDNDGGSATLGDLQEDPSAAQAFQTAENELYTEELHTALEEALNKLTPRQADIIRRHYFGGKSFAEIAREDGTSTVAPRNHEVSAFIALRQNPALARWHDDIISTKAWSGTGFGVWNHRGSVEERTVEYLDDWEAKNRAWAAEREKLIREHYAGLEAAGYFDRHPECRANLEPRTDPKESTPPGGEV